MNSSKENDKIHYKFP